MCWMGKIMNFMKLLCQSEQGRALWLLKNCMTYWLGTNPISTVWRLQLSSTSSLQATWRHNPIMEETFQNNREYNIIIGINVSKAWLAPPTDINVGQMEIEAKALAHLESLVTIKANTPTVANFVNRWTTPQKLTPNYSPLSPVSTAYQHHLAKRKLGF